MASRGYSIYELVRILDSRRSFKLDSLDVGAPSDPGDDCIPGFSDSLYDESATFDAVAVGSIEEDHGEDTFDHGGDDYVCKASFSFLALACSGGRILLRYSKSSVRGSSSLPILRHLKWLQGPLKRIRCMSFSNDLVHLACVAYDGSMYILPALSVALKSRYAASNNDPDGGPNCSLFRTAAKRAQDRARKGYSTATIIGDGLDDSREKIVTKRVSTGPLEGKATSCAWWRSCDGKMWSVVGSSDGQIGVFELAKDDEGPLCVANFPTLVIPGIHGFFTLRVVTLQF